MPLITKDLLNFDPLSEAEKMTGKSYKEDKVTSELGLLLHILHSQNKENRFKENLDTYFSQPLNSYLEVVNSLGFIKCYEEDFIDYYGTKEKQYAFYLPEGVFLKFDTYNGKQINGSEFYYILEVPKDYCPRGSGCYSHENNRRIWIGHMDGREGLKYNINMINLKGTLLKWTEIKPDFEINLSTICRTKKNIDYSKNINQMITDTQNIWNTFPKEFHDIFGKESPKYER